jgi:cation diffusion facilitator CzcD-associated flavoprotein CzcO
MFPPQHELLGYFQSVWREFGIDVNTRLNTIVTECEWIDVDYLWKVVINGPDGPQTLYSKSVVAATGIFSEPKAMDIVGADLFTGSMFHSSRWDGSVDMQNKDVVVIGNGCSATQFVPEIAKVAKSVYQIMRSPHHIDPPLADNKGHGFVYTFLCKYVPGFQWIIRSFFFLLLDLDFLVFLKRVKLSRWIHGVVSRWYTWTYGPSKYYSELVPNHEYGLKRRVFDSDYLNCLHRPNVTLKRGIIEKIVEDGVFIDNKKVHADIIIFANGFKVQRFLGNIKVKGTHEYLHEKWERFRKPKAYNGGILAGFPNFVLLMGPNTVTGHHSVMFTTECMTDYAMKLFSPLYATQLQKIDLKQEHEDEYQKWIDEQLEQLIWQPNGVTGWYVNKQGNSMIFPSFQTHFWYINRKVCWKHFDLF